MQFSRIDRVVDEFDSLHGTTIARLRLWWHGGPDRDPASIREALQEYVDRIHDFVNEEREW